MEINYLAVLVCGVLAMILGAVWYGPLFSRKWAEVIGANMNNPAEVARMKKNAMPLYLLQFLLTLFQVYILSHYIQGWNEVSGLENALWILAGFVLPTIAGGSMWNNDSLRKALTRFSLQAGYQLILFIAFGLILGAWK